MSGRHRLLSQPLALSLAILGLIGSHAVLAQEPRSLPSIKVVGDAEDETARQPGAVAIVTTEELELQQPRSTEEALRAVPGVTIKGEEESAIVVNIGIRGLSSADYKTLMLEDGVPVAPGLFVGNGRYYNPRIQRMESIEVLKGAASLRYGPSTIGGVINYLTKQPKDGLEISLRGGSWNNREASVELGATSASQDAKFGAVITRASSDGFMDKGYDMTDVMLKAGMALGESQWLSLKYTDYQNDANISYRGLFLQDYKDGKRYNPAPDDYFITNRRGIDLNHEWEINETTKLNTLVYGSETVRDYWRYSTDNPASMAAGRWVYTDNLAGNNRRFERFGVETRLQLQHQLFGVTSETELGLRFMDEEMLDQNVAATRATPRTGTLNTDRIDSAESLAFYAQNRFLLSDKLAVTAGLRAESYEQSRLDKKVPNTSNKVDTSNTEWLPGLGLTYQINHGLQMFASVYKAFSPALNSDALTGMEDQQLDAERSVNIEAGLRGNSGRFTYEATAFRMDFDNQIIPANSNSDFQRTNGGKTLHQGLEGALLVDLGAGFAIKSSATYIADAEFDGNRVDANGNITTPDGNRVTYTPEWVANLALEYAVGSLRSSLSVHHTGKQYTDVLNTREIAENTSGFFTGQIDGYTLVDLNLVYDFSKQLRLSTSVKNLLDEYYIASLRQGIYVGPERSVDVGVSYRF